MEQAAADRKRICSAPTPVRVGDALLKARVDEARCAAMTLGAPDPILLGLPDGKLGDHNAAPQENKGGQDYERVKR